MTTFDLDRRVRDSALKLKDTVLLAKLSVGDLISQEAVYHNKCLVSLYNRAERLEPVSNFNNVDHESEGIALAELISYIEESKLSSTTKFPVFKPSNLVKLYSNRLAQLGFQIDGRIHSTRHNLCDEAITLSKAAKIVRRDMMQTGFHFNGEFEANIQKDSISSSLLCFVSMILRGSKMNLQNVQETQTALTLSLLLMYNSTFRRANANRQSSAINHVRSRETPLPIYIGMLIHAKTRKKGRLINFLNYVIIRILGY